MLTPKQHQLLMFIHERLQKTGISPSFDEMKEALALKSKSGIHRLITALEERGFIQRLPHKARALQVLRLPETATGDASALAVLRPKRASGFNPSVIEGSKPVPAPRETAPANLRENHGAMVPVMGRIAAGSPIEAIQTESHQVGVPQAMLRRHGRHYALEVNGDSMVEAGILDGDTVIIQECADAESGEIVVALVDDEEATLKRLRSRGQTIALEAANPEYETRIYRSDQVKVQGRLVGLLRRY